MTLSGKAKARALEAGDATVDKGDAKNIGRLPVAVPFDIDEQEDTGKSFGQRCDHLMRFVCVSDRICMRAWRCQFALLQRAAPLVAGRSLWRRASSTH